ncbi:MAG: RDD family protein [Ignavibacteriales bacterium]
MNTTKAGLARRALAFAADGVICMVLALVPVVGLLLSAVYMLARDGLMDGRSPGKRLVNLRVVRSDTGRGAAYVDSVKRNAIFAVPDVLLIAPSLATIVAAPLSVAVLLLEVVFMLTDPEAMRLGDRFARTRVVYELPQGARQRVA